MIDIRDYKRFMGIDFFPEFEIELYKIDESQVYVYGGRAEYDLATQKHKLLLPSNIDITKCLLYHELTHIWDMESNANGDRNHDFCMTGYMEYHASQIELLVLMGAESINDNIAFSMHDLVSPDWSVQKYLDNKLETAKLLIQDFDAQKRIDGLGCFFNFLGLKSICSMYATDFIDNYKYQEFITKIPSFLFLELKMFMNGWVVDIDMAVNLYSHVYHAIIS